MSDLSTSINKDYFSNNQCVEGDDIPVDGDSLVKEVLARTSAITISSVQPSGSIEQREDNSTGNHELHFATSKALAAELPSDVDKSIGTNTTAVVAATLELKNNTKKEGEWIECSSRLSNKKRRKQMKLAKRAAALAAMSSSTSPPNVSVTKVAMKRRCGGKQVAPMLSMNKAIIGI
jgi:hypothetical protein